MSTTTTNTNQGISKPSINVTDTIRSYKVHGDLVFGQKMVVVFGQKMVVNM
jgi:hypothetical protein